MAALSPMMQQYFEIKKQHPDKLLFFRLGDFYEMFYDDAIVASKELELTLTGRDCGQAERAPMCGVPFHSYESYVAKLIEKGYKVAICEQMEDPALAKGLVKRDVVRVVTPGTVIEQSMLQDDKNNFIASILIEEGRAGLCFADVSTGEAHVTCISGQDLSAQMISELCRYAPSEVLFNSAILDYKDVTAYIKQQLACAVELLDDDDFEPQACKARVEAQFSGAFCSATGCEADGLQARALGALLFYLEATQKKGIERLKNVHAYAGAQYMHLSPVTRTNLELTQTMRGREKKGTLLWVLDKTSTAMGKRLLRAWVEQPLVSARAINRRLDAVEELVGGSVTRAELAQALGHVYDLERLMTRTVYGSATPREVYALACTCSRLPEIKGLCEAFCGEMLTGLAGEIDELEDVKEQIFHALNEELPVSLKDGGVIRPGYNQEVDELRDIMHGGKGYLAQLEAKLKEETGIRTLKIGYNRVFGYYIEVSRSFTSQVPANFVRKQTLANAERYITEELKTLENKILGASERLLVLEHQLFDDLLHAVAAQLVRIQRTAGAVAQLDVLVALAQVAVNNGYSRPVVDTSDKLIIEEGRHPVIEQMLSGAPFVPNDTVLDCIENRMLIITGPNMAGKSTYMRQTALIALMAQLGSFVPARRCEMGVVDAIFTRVGASDDLAAGQSTFMVEMTEVAEILRHATANSLLVLDEIGRGTSTFDGMSIARAVLEYVHDKKLVGAKTLFATHYHELTAMEDILPGVKNFNIAVKKRGDDITFLRRIVRGGADDSFGIEVAKLAGVPDKVIRRAKQVLAELEQGGAEAQRTSHHRFSEEPVQLTMDSVDGQVLQKLRSLDVNALTPIQCMNTLFELCSMLK